MKRYVDVDELKENICKRVNNPTIRGWLNRLIDNTPTADVVPVVRCKDCRLATEDTMIDGWYYCHNNGMTHKPDTFCSYGEHKRRKK
jgi:hypothetical protein